jgi:hypothetical protein
MDLKIQLDFAVAEYSFPCALKPWFFTRLMQPGH